MVVMDRSQARGLDLFICFRAVASSCTLSHHRVSSEPVGSSPNSSLIRLRARAGFPECPGKALDTVQATPSTDGTSPIYREPPFSPASIPDQVGGAPSFWSAGSHQGQGCPGYGHHDLTTWK